MHRHPEALLIVAALVLAGCAGAEPVPEAAEPSGQELDASDPTILRRPFTAEEIRDEWTVGLTLKIASTTLEGETVERWTVVAADDEGADIEYVMLDAEDNAIGEPRVEHAGWIELRDHASFLAASSRRKEVTRDTALGRLDGWLYTVEEANGDNVTEFFFAKSLPGAPVHVRMARGDELLMEMRQLERSRPE